MSVTHYNFSFCMRAPQLFIRHLLFPDVFLLLTSFVFLGMKQFVDLYAVSLDVITFINLLSRGVVKKSISDIRGAMEK